MDREKAEVYKIAADILLKGIVVLVVCAGWFVMVIALVKNPNLALGGATVGTPWVMMRVIGDHFFPKIGTSRTPAKTKQIAPKAGPKPK